MPAGSPVTGREVWPAAYPRGEVRASDFQIVEADVPDPMPGEVLVRNTWTSVDAALRLRLREQAPPGYFPSFPLGQPMDGIMTVGEVVDSRAEGFAPGDTVWHASGWRDYAVVEAGRPALNGIGTLTKLDLEVGPPQAYLGVLGGNGLTAYVGLLHIAGLREDDVVWVSAAAGCVGSLAAQIAKIRGHRVIGSAGSDEKVRYLLDELGLDAAFNYKSGPLRSLLEVAAPDGIDVYFDNVGGDHLEAALGSLRRSGRVAVCGMISQYSPDDPPPGPRNLFLTVAKDLTIRGFRGSSHAHLLPEVSRELGAWVRDGSLRYRETIVDGLEHAPEALAGLMRGDNTGKTIVRIADPSHGAT
jgi:NADPH-dependent curcumin reductase CurA